MILLHAKPIGAAVALALLLITTSVSLAAAQAPLVETTIAQENGETVVAAYAGWVVWSSFNEDTHRWRLIGRRPGFAASEPFAISTRPVPFDVDLGPDGTGRPTAVYSRCRPEHNNIDPIVDTGAYLRSRRCRIVKLDLATGRERTLYRRSGASLIYPTLWRNRLAYVVRGRRPDDLHLELRVRSHGHVATTTLGRAPAQKTELPEDGPTRLDLWGKNLVFAWASNTLGCRGASADAGDGRDPFVVTRVYLQRGSQQRKLLDKGCDLVDQPGSVALAAAPAISDGFVTWVRMIARSTPGYDTHLRRRSLRSRTTTSIPIAATYDSLAVDGRMIYAQVGLFTIVGAQLP